MDTIQLVIPHVHHLSYTSDLRICICFTALRRELLKGYVALNIQKAVKMGIMVDTAGHVRPPPPRPPHPPPKKP